MSKQHDENKDLRSLSHIAKISQYDKSIKCNKSATIGIKMWGKIDFLTKYRGWHFVWDNSVGNTVISADTASVDKKKIKAESKHTLKDKRK